MIRYRTCIWNENIEKICIIRESESNVWLLTGVRENKITQYHQYHDSFEKAKEFLYKKTLRSLNYHKNEVDTLNKRLENIKQLKENI